MNKNEYKEDEVKILDVDVEHLKLKLEELGAKKVYQDYREVISLDTSDRELLTKKDKLIRITDEGSVKVTMHVNQSKQDEKQEIKFKVSRMKEVIDFFAELDIKPVTEVKEKRTSYELGKVDFDIDEFPMIPPFLEIDKEFLESEGYTLDELLEKFDLTNNKVVVMGTEDIHSLYGIDYFEVYKV